MITRVEKEIAKLADIKLRVEGVDKSDLVAVKTCLLNSMHGVSMWNAWKKVHGVTDEV